jgi:Tfp pilus assembly protein PilN
MTELVLWLLLVTLTLVVLFLAVRIGFKRFKDSIEGHERKIDFHRRENILSNSRHENRLNALEEKTRFLHEELENIKAKQDKKKNRARAQATV